ncbi:MAG: sigma 54-interacting transcriptional regulator [Mailhella sp.]|nr:sigma 54-interacting transcriptional regulator [Mailhella sp.]
MTPGTFTPTVEESYHRLLAHIPGLAYRCRASRAIDNDGTEYFSYSLEFVSEGSLSLLGIPPQDMLEQNRNVIELMTHPDDLYRMRREIHESVIAHKPYQVMYRVILPGNIIKWVWDQGEGVYDPDGGLWYLEGLMMDISEQKFMELSLREENRQFVDSTSKLFGLGGLVGQSEGMRRVYELMLKAAKTDSNVIIYGETGSGKDVAARAIHALSGRKGAYVPVNCGAIPETLLESEFFGHTRGAFTGASGSKEGYIAAADGGTLFLDEIGELPLHLQVKLLRTLENKMYMPVGSHTPRTSSFRLIAATNQNLSRMVKENRMRADFYYRIHVLAITIPPLRERTGDIPLLTAAWQEKRGEQLDIPLNVRLAMERYNWPGNVRELHNFLDRFAAFGEASLDTLGEAARTPIAMLLPDLKEGVTLEEAVSKLEEKLILQALEACRWHRGEAASRLGLNLRTMQRKMKQFGISGKGKKASA